MKERKKFEGFTSAGKPELGLALVFDISGFTNFFNKPDLQYYITKYINEIIDCVETAIFGGDGYWGEGADRTLKPLSIKPSMRKFMGDGVLYIWEDTEQKLSSSSSFKMALINRVWNVQKKLHVINEKLYNELPIADLPKAIKFGIAQGTIYRLIEKDGGEDFIGPCINLASRLVKYCPEINFIGSARLNLPQNKLEDTGYIKLIALELRSFENEIVIVDKDDYANISAVDKKRLFKEIKNNHTTTGSGSANVDSVHT